MELIGINPVFEKKGHRRINRQKKYFGRPKKLKKRGKNKKIKNAMHENAMRCDASYFLFKKGSQENQSTKQLFWPAEKIHKWEIRAARNTEFGLSSLVRGDCTRRSEEEQGGARRSEEK